MPIITSPPAIIFINNDLTEQVQSVFVRQLYITQVMDGYTFDGYVAADGYYPLSVHHDGYRILVMRDLSDQTNRKYADITLFAKDGLVSVESNNYGPPGITLRIDTVYLTALINLNTHQICHPFWGREDIYDCFLGHPISAYNRDYRWWVMDFPRPTPPEPLDDGTIFQIDQFFDGFKNFPFGG